MITLQLSQDFLLHIAVTHCQQGKHLSLSTQWLGAKNPQSHETQYKVTLTPQQLLQIANYLKESA